MAGFRSKREIRSFSLRLRALSRFLSEVDSFVRSGTSGRRDIVSVGKAAVRR